MVSKEMQEGVENDGHKVFLGMGVQDRVRSGDYAVRATDGQGA